MAYKRTNTTNVVGKYSENNGKIMNFFFFVYVFL